MRKIVMLTILAAVVLQGFAEDLVLEELSGRTEAKEYHATDGGVFRYRWSEPKAPEVGRTYPLVILMHGAGERGTNNVCQLQWGAKQILDFLDERKEGYFFVAGQVPDGIRWVEVDWGLLAHKIPNRPSETMARQIEFLEKLFAERTEIDRSRVYVTGLSMGGFGTWDILCRRPDWFAAAMPICGGCDVSQAWKLRNIPVWIHHGDKDTVVPTVRSRSMTAALWACEGNVKYTEHLNRGHDSWLSAYGKREFLEWLFSQRKDRVGEFK